MLRGAMFDFSEGYSDGRLSPAIDNLVIRLPYGVACHDRAIGSSKDGFRIGKGETAAVGLRHRIARRAP